MDESLDLTELPECTITDDGDRTARTSNFLKWEGTWSEFQHDSGACSHAVDSMETEVRAKVVEQLQNRTYGLPPDDFATFFTADSRNGESIARVLTERHGESEDCVAKNSSTRQGLAVTFMYSGGRDFW